LLLVLALSLFVASAPPAFAKRAPDRSPEAAALVARAPDLVTHPVTGGRVLDGVQRMLDSQSGTLRRWWLRDGSALPVSKAAPRDIAAGFLAAHATELGITPEHLERDLTLASEKASPSGTHFRWNQQVDGVPVYRSEIVVKVSPRGQVSSVQNNLAGELAVPTTPALSQKQAVQAGLATVRPTGRALGEYGAELAIVPLEGGARLAWLVSVPNEQPMGDWQVFVDARSGEVFGVVDRMVYADGTGQVFDPDPMSKMGDSSYVDNNDADTAVPFPGAYDIRTLPGLTLTSGTYSLDGPYARLIDNESPTTAPVTATHPDSFRYQRSPSGFEDVNCYFQLDHSERYIQSLGFTNVNNRVQEVDSHGLSGDDNSHYVPSTKRLAFGEGGVDDAEDADVIWHEYGHSIQDNIQPGWGGGQEGAMGEGFGDYWAGSYSLSLYPAFRPNFVFTWDGHNEFWAGRLLVDHSFHYPEDCCGEVHDSGTLWCSGLIDCWYQVGREVMDKLVLDHHFALGTSATMADAANQIIQSDIDLYGGAHLSALVERFGIWGFVDPADFVPQITHTPRTDTEDVTGPYAVVATVVSTQPLAAGSPTLLWGVGGAITDSVAMSPAGPANQFTADLPGPGVAADIRYYLRALDTNGGSATHPSGAPGNVHVFHVGPDVTPPSVIHAALSDWPELTWPATVSATVTDNFGVASVSVDWTLNGLPKPAFALLRVGVTDVYAAAFPSTQDSVAPGDQVTYHLTALDVATIPNSTRHPASGEHAFQIISARGVVLVLDDDEVALRAGTKQVEDPDVKGGTITLKAEGNESVASANALAAILDALGYVTTVEPAATSNPATWPGYSFIVSASGANTAPVASATYRSALEAYVAAGHKLMVEGGEVGYDAASYPGYPTFAANVLHVTTWESDDAGALQVVPAQAGHPLATLPNVLPATLPIAYVGYGNEDAVKPAVGATVVYQTANKLGDAGILAWDDDPAPQAGQIVYLAFDVKVLGDAALRSQVVENAAAYLLATQSQPTGSISGHVSFGTSYNGAGVTLTLSPTGQTTVSDPAGDYGFTGLYATTYTVSGSKTGYQPATRTGVIVLEGQETQHADLRLFPQFAASVCRQPGRAIPDNSSAGMRDTIRVADVFAVKSATVSLNLTHTFIGDLIVELTHGTKTVRLHNRTGSSSDNIIGVFPTTLAVDGPGTLADFVNEPANGDWILFVSDNASIDTGTLNQWCVNLAGPADSTVTAAVGEPAPTAVALSPVTPNPSRGNGAAIRFGLPRPGAASLALYDVSGRRVRSLVEGALDAGVHVCRWNGRDDSGRALSPGIYLVRLRAGGTQLTQRMVVIH
jgi:subtilisin-like proprotein convertase family protein